MIRRPVAIAAGVAVVLVAGCSVAYAQTQNSSGSYRTAAVVVGDVNQTLSLSGTITASSRRDLSFGAGGTVKKVQVASGDVVRSGQTLATLDATDLSAAVTKARATLAKAEAQLETDQSSQTATVTAATTSASTSTAAKSPAKTSSGASGGSSDDSSKKSTEGQQGSSPALTKALAKLKAQQAAVTRAQTASTQAITAAKAALAAQVKACEDATEITEAAEPAEGEEAEGEGAEGPTASLSAGCTTALDAVQAAQDVVAAKQDVLQTALQTLASTLSEAAKATNTTTGAAPTSGSKDSSSTKAEEPSASTPSAGTSSASAPSGGSGSGSGGSGGGTTVTAATLAKDQAEIDTARAALAEAEQTREAAELTAPFAGEVLSVSVVKGDDVSSSDVVIVMVGTGSTTATTTVTLEQVAKVSKGQKAQVTPAGASKPVAGTVTSIGMLPDSSTDTSTYPVTIDLDDDVAAPEGATATISLIIGTAEGVLTVPSSAVTTTGRTTVSVLTDKKVSMTPVTVGVIGSTRTEITAGLKKGQTVVLGDLNASLPGGDGTTTSLPTSGRGGFGGGGMPGGGRPSGGGRG